MSKPRDGGPPQRSDQTRVVTTRPIRCDVGGRPDYFVPAHRLPALLGCARLGVSGKRVEFSGHQDRIDGEFHLCIDPAYSGRGQRGIFIPAICKLVPPVTRFAVHDADQPRQAVRGYAYVIWGIAGTSTDVVVRFAGGTAQAAVFTVGAKLARSFGESPFGLFVVELPLSAACAFVTVAGKGPDATERIPPRPRVCERGS